jgi:deoxyribodipyrimidine photolyase-related protein
MLCCVVVFLMSNTVSVWILGDQLSADWPGWLEREGLDRASTVIVLVESAAKCGSRPWHRHKLTLVLSAMRHFAEALRADGWTVDYRRAPDFARGLAAHARAHKPARWLAMTPSTYQGAQFVRAALAERPYMLWPNRMFLGAPADLGSAKSPLLETFYRKMRTRTGLLMDGDAPAGGAWNLDADNRQPPTKDWRAGRTGDIPALPRFEPDAITRAVIDDVAHIDGAWGEADGFALPVTRADALAFLDDFIAHRLAKFGPYEDAMVTDQPVLFHSLLSPLLNIGLLGRDEVCRAAERAYRAGDAPLASVEGFIRQIIGWREFVYACYWREMPALGASNALDVRRALPPAFWDPSKTRMRCLSQSAGAVWQNGYSHHIQRLMVLCNIALLAGISPRQVNDWFLCAYIDAYDWVVTPNVIGMGLYADGGVVGTKPYAASANYINKMSTYCTGCHYDAKQRTGERACPLNALYWDFIARNEARFSKNPRMTMPVASLRKLPAAERAAIAQQAAGDLAKLEKGAL